ncbi:MAG: hypothetical protein GY909_08885 [Oligoflexia bacterium]|nr:hypothetical protein [Oligoflexia bacterium]
MNNINENCRIDDDFLKLADLFNKEIERFGFKKLDSVGYDSTRGLMKITYLTWKKNDLYIFLENIYNDDDLRSFSIKVGKKDREDYHIEKRGFFGPLPWFDYFSVDFEFCYLEGIDENKDLKNSKNVDEYFSWIIFILDNEVLKAILNDNFWFNYRFDIRDFMTTPGMEKEMREKLEIEKKKYKLL